jgi:hypothetical protein
MEIRRCCCCCGSGGEYIALLAADLRAGQRSEISRWCSCAALESGDATARLFLTVRECVFYWLCHDDADYMWQFKTAVKCN